MGATRPNDLSRVTATDDGWRFYVGTRTGEERRRLFWFMTRRSVWAMARHGRRGTPGRCTVAAAAFGLFMAPVYWWVGAPMGVVIALPPLMAATIIVVVLPLSILVAAPIRLWRLCRPQSGWITHWCEGPQGQLAVRMTRPRRTPPNNRLSWPGRDFCARAGAGRRLLEWLQRLADQHRAEIIITTTSGPLIRYYQRSGFILARKPRYGVATLCYQAKGDTTVDVA